MVHAEELAYIFIQNTTILVNENDAKMRKIMCRMWMNFVKFKNPTPKVDETLQNVIWPRTSQRNFIYLNIDKNLTVENANSTIFFWNNLYNKYGEGHFETY